MLNIVCIAEQEKNIQPGIGTNSQLSKFTNKTRHIVFIAPVWRAIRIYIEPCVADYFTIRRQMRFIGDIVSRINLSLIHI